MSKKVTFAAKPSAKAAASADTWVENRKTAATEDEAMKRLTFDIPETLHRRIKTQCASKGIKMTDELRVLLEKHFPEQQRA
jgi:hypothetical protein